MTRTARVAACQTPDIRGNIDDAVWWIQHYAQRATAQDVELLCFPEGFLQGYETRDRDWAHHYALDLTSPHVKHQETPFSGHLLHRKRHRQLRISRLGFCWRKRRRSGDLKCAALFRNPCKWRRDWDSNPLTVIL